MYEVKLWFDIFIAKPSIWILKYFCADIEAAIADKKDQLMKFKAELVVPLFASLKTLILR